MVSSSPISLLVIIFSIAAAVMNILQAVRWRIRHVAVPPEEITMRLFFIRYNKQNRVKARRNGCWQTAVNVEGTVGENNESTRHVCIKCTWPSLFDNVKALFLRSAWHIFGRISIVQHRQLVVKYAIENMYIFTRLTVAAASGKASWRSHRSPGYFEDNLNRLLDDESRRDSDQPRPTVGRHGAPLSRPDGTAFNFKSSLFLHFLYFICLRIP